MTQPAAPRIGGRHLVISLIMLALFAPVFLSSGSAAFRPAWFTARIGPLPVSAWMGVMLIAAGVLMVWVVARLTLGGRDGEADAPAKETRAP